MIADMMPWWLWNLLGMSKATLPTDDWTWRHTLRYGQDPARIFSDEAEYRRRHDG